MLIAEGIAAAKLATDVTKLTLDLLRTPKPDTEAIRSRLIELQDLILSTKFALSDAQEENRELKAENSILKDISEIKKRMKPTRDGIYWLPLADGKLDGRFCCLCFDDRGKQIRCVDVGIKKDNKYFECPADKSRYTLGPYDIVV